VCGGRFVCNFLTFSLQIKGITKEWGHTPVGFQADIQKNPGCRTTGLVFQFKHQSWAKAMFLSQHWWDSGTA
jgi:hypothetical protein